MGECVATAMSTPDGGATVDASVPRDGAVTDVNRVDVPRDVADAARADVNGNGNDSDVVVLPSQRPGCQCSAEGSRATGASGLCALGLGVVAVSRRRRPRR